jgi:hypothetical protein
LIALIVAINGGKGKYSRHVFCSFRVGRSEILAMTAPIASVEEVEIDTMGQRTRLNSHALSFGLFGRMSLD